MKKQNKKRPGTTAHEYRIVPDTLHAMIIDELKHKYQGMYGEDEIMRYWQHDCYEASASELNEAFLRKVMWGGLSPENGDCERGGL